MAIPAVLALRSSTVELYGVPKSRIISGFVRVRIVKPLTGVIEGHPLSSLIPGYIYEIDDFTGEQLLALNAAVEVRSTDPVLATPSTASDDVDVERVAGGVIVIPADTADDRPEKRRRKRR